MPLLSTGIVETDCRTEEGITVGLIDSLISICRILAKRDASGEAVGEALKDLYSDPDVQNVIPVLAGFFVKGGGSRTRCTGCNVEVPWVRVRDNNRFDHAPDCPLKKALSWRR